jgi:hypothetical protein
MYFTDITDVYGKDHTQQFCYVGKMQRFLMLKLEAYHYCWALPQVQQWPDHLLLTTHWHGGEQTSSQGSKHYLYTTKHFLSFSKMSTATL